MASAVASGLLVVALHDVVALDADLAGDLVALDGLARVVDQSLNSTPQMGRPMEPAFLGLSRR
jgi:hypothetical protein